jgi:hypothetical protein
MISQACTIVLGSGFLAATALGCGGFVSTSLGAASRVPLAPPGVYVDTDVADGYQEYAAALAPAGAWEADGMYGVRWCPTPAGERSGAFRPYVSRGHWTTSDRAAYGAGSGTPYWTSDDAAPWTEITTHHGWWIDVRDRAPAGSEWCWVPGLEPTPARVVWRSGDAFVGWAPEPPAWVDDGGDNVSIDFEWVFELVATLLEDSVDGYVLTGDAASRAGFATSRSQAGDEQGFSRRPPAKPVVAAARQQLVAYLRAHPNETGLASAATATSSSRSTSSGASGTASGGTSTSRGTASKHREDTDDAAATGGVRLPSGVFLTAMIVSDPVMVRPPPSGYAGPSGRSAGWTSAGASSGPSGHAAGASASHSSGVSSSFHATSHGSSSSSSSHAGTSHSSSSFSHKR